MSENQIDSWKKYKEWVGTVIENKKDYYYRGQMDPRWKLQTTFHRYADDLKMNLSDYLDYMIPEVHYHISAIYNEVIDLQNPVEFGSFLALLQHHGFPTPMLDWTLSPYIAAYFAFREIDDKSPQCDNVKIFIFDYQEWIATYKQPLDFRDISSNYVSVIRPFSKYNPRMIPQRGTYSATNLSDMEKYLLQCSTQAKKTFLYTVTLPVYERTRVMRELSLMGINEMTLFPGLDGLCSTFKEQFFSRDESD